MKSIKIFISACLWFALSSFYSTCNKLLSDCCGVFPVNLRGERKVNIIVISSKTSAYSITPESRCFICIALLFQTWSVIVVRKLRMFDLVYQITAQPIDVSVIGL